MIQVRELTKHFSATRALGPVSFDIADGEAVGFLGLNGAGKTTALRILACDLRPSAGSVSVAGVDAIANPHEVRRHIGFVPESPPLYGDMPVADFLSFAGRLRGMSAADVRRRLPEVMAVTHLEDVADELIRNLSHGFRQRVNVAQAIVHRPRLLILDEPTRGLDPVQIVEMRGMIRDLRKQHTILISSHILPEISETCDRLLVLGEGTIIARGTEAELSAELLASRRVVVGVRPKAGATRDDVERALRAVPGVSDVTAPAQASEPEDGFVELEVAADGDARAAIARALVEAGHDLVRLDRAKKRLESIFLELVKGGAPAQGEGVHARAA